MIVGVFAITKVEVKAAMEASGSGPRDLKTCSKPLQVQNTCQKDCCWIGNYAKEAVFGVSAKAIAAAALHAAVVIPARPSRGYRSWRNAQVLWRGRGKVPPFIGPDIGTGERHCPARGSPSMPTSPIPTPLRCLGGLCPILGSSAATAFPLGLVAVAG